MTSGSDSYSRTPFFIDGAAGRLFAILFEPRGERRGQVLFCPPFAEEMNKSRRMMTLTAERLADRGYVSLVLDLYGTGDSAGDFEDARWETWITDLERGLKRVAEQNELKTSLCGIRLGAGLAFELCSRHADAIDQVLLWQPVLSGKAHMTQFLRLKIAAQLTSSGPKTSTKELREAAASGEVIEVAGYALHPDLIEPIDRLDISNVTPPEGKRIGWYEVVAEEGNPVTVVSRKLGDAWRETVIDFEQLAVQGEPFWTTQEIGLSEALIEKTVDRLAAT